MVHLHPFTVLIYYLSILTLLTFTFYPIFSILGLLGVLLTNRIIEKRIERKQMCFYLLLLLFLMFSNPLFIHKGETVLFYVLQKPFTLEALIYGGVMAVTVVSVFLWCRQMSFVFSTDRILFLFGSFSPKTGLIISMVLGFIPKLRAHYQKVIELQDFFMDEEKDGIFVFLHKHMRSFLATTTWALEHSMETADSMRARGYGTGRRTHYHRYRFRLPDFILCLLQSIMFAGVALMKKTVPSSVYYYPIFRYSYHGIWELMEYILLAGVLLVIPVVSAFGSPQLTCGRRKQRQKGQYESTNS